MYSDEQIMGGNAAEEELQDLIEGVDEDGNNVLLEVVRYFFYNGEEYVVLGEAHEGECDCEECEHCDHHEDIRKTLSENSFDQVIASVHYIEQTDPYYGGYYDGKDWRQAYGTYLETIYREMTWLRDFDIMGHFDYIVRYAPYPQESIRYRDFSDIMDEMFRFLIDEGKALEINTKSYQNFKGRHPVLDRDVLLRYKELGGEIISLGSDSHSPECVGTSFDTYAALLKSFGFRWTAHYEKRKLVQMPL